MKRLFRDFLDKIGQYNQLVSDYKKAVDTSPDHAMAHVNWGVELAGEGKMDEALEKFEAAAAIAPNRWEVLTNWGVALAKMDQLEAAISKFQAALAISPQAVNNYVLWGAALIELGQVEEAVEKYQKAIELNPQNPEPYVNWGIALARVGDYYGALKQFKAALAIHGYQPQVFFLWGAVLAELGDYEAAIEKFRTTLRFLPKHADSYYFWSVCLNRIGRYPDALEKSKQAVQLELERPEVYLNQGDILANLTQWETAITNYRHAVMLAPDMAEAYLSWGSVLCKMGVPDSMAEALEKLNKAQALNPELVGLAQQFGQYYLELAEYEQALPWFEKAGEESPTNIDVRLNLAMSLIKLGRSDEAMAHLKTLAEHDRWNPQMNFLVGTHFMGLGDYQKASMHLKKALEERPEFEDASINYSLVLCELGEPLEAVRQMRAVLRKTPDTSSTAAKVHFFYGMVLARSGDVREAILKHQKAIALDAQYAEPLLGLGEIYLKQSQWEQAEVALQQALSLQPASKGGLYLLGELKQKQAAMLPSSQQAEARQAALSLFDQVLAQDPAHLEAGCRRTELLGLTQDVSVMNTAFEMLLAEKTEAQQAQILVYWAEALAGLGYAEQSASKRHEAVCKVPDIEQKMSRE